MGSHGDEPQVAPLTRRRLREVERTTDATSELPSGWTTRPGPSSPLSAPSGSVPVAPRGGPADPASAPGASSSGLPTPPDRVTRYVSRPSAEPTVVTPVRPMVAQSTPGWLTVAQPTPDRLTLAQPAQAAGDAPAAAGTGRRAARAAAATQPAALATPPSTAPRVAPSSSSSSATTSRRAARAAQTSTETVGAPAPMRRARPRAQSSVAIPVLPDRVTSTAETAPGLVAVAPQTDAPVARPASFLVTHPAVPAAEPVAVLEPALHRPSRVVRTTSAAEETAIVPAILADERTPWELADTGEVATTTAPGTVSRTATTRRPGRRTRVATRLGVLGVLAGITVIVPVSQGIVPAPVAYGSDALADSTLPSTVTALAGSQLSDLPPASLVSSDGALAARDVSTGASRNDIRSSLPGCDGSVRDAGQNGQLKQADLCTLWDNHTQLRADAAVSLAEFNQAFAARFGADLCLSSGYRTLAEQRAVKAQKGGLAAAPGKSNHGWGLAVDLCQDQTSGAKWAWLNENGPAYGWANPAWALPGGSGPHEKWHWEYVKGVQADGEYYDG